MDGFAVWMSSTRFPPMKKSLILSDKDRYPSAKPLGDGEKPKERKTAPTIALTGKQVDAFCGCDLKPGDSGSATVHYVVKAASSGDQYGDDLPSKKSADKKLTLALTHVETDEKGDDEEDEETPEDIPEEKNGDEEVEKTPTRLERDTVSPSEALGDDED